MKRLLLILAILLCPISSFAQTGSPVQFSGGGKFKGGTLTSNLTMSDGTIIELATGSLTNLAFRFRTDTNTGFYSPSGDVITLVIGGSDATKWSSSSCVNSAHLSAYSLTANSDSLGTLYPTGAAPGFFGWMAGYKPIGGLSLWQNATTTRMLLGPGVDKDKCDIGMSLYGPTGGLYGVNAGLQPSFEWAEWSISSDTRDVSFAAVSSGTGRIGKMKFVYKTSGMTGPESVIAEISTQSVSIKVPVTHNVASNGYTIYQGNAAYSATGEDYVTLPVNIAATSIAFDSDTVGYIRAEVSGKNSTDSSCIHVELKAEYENFGDTLAFIGSPSSTTSQLNAATWSASLSAADDDLSILATGTPGTIWQVKKLEIGGL